MDKGFKPIISLPPHIHSGVSPSGIMLTVVIALMPAVIASITIFGAGALSVYAATVGSCLVFEYVFNKICRKENTLRDLSALVTGILLAMTLPAGAPLWICIIGGFVAIVMAKMLFGGLGGNVFNPALVARVFLLVSFPVQMTRFAAPRFVDSVSGATLLASAKTYFSTNETLAGFEIPRLVDLFGGLNTGSLGETSVVALLIGAAILLARRIITWHIPLSFIGTVFLLTLGHSIAHPGMILPPAVHIFSGGLLLGAFFMATDYVTTPLYPKGKIIFGVGCGVLTVVIRLYGGYPEGVAFAILIMNAVTPLLDKYLRPRAYGEAV